MNDRRRRRPETRDVSDPAGRPPVPLAESLGAVVRSLRDEPTRPDPYANPSGEAAGAAAGASVSASVSASVMASVMGGVFGRWEEAVGSAVAAHVQPVKLHGTTLVVEVDDPAWATQLRFLDATLRARLAEVAGATIETVEVRVRRR